MNNIVRRLPIWSAAAAVAAAGVLIVAPTASASACGAQAEAESGGGPARVVHTEPAGLIATASPVQVRGPGSLAMPAGSRTAFGITVVNSGPRFAGRIRLSVAAKDSLKLPVVTMETATSSGSVKTWITLTPTGSADTPTFAAGGLNFVTGESSSEFRIGVPLDALSRQLHVGARVDDAAGRVVGAAEFDATVTDAALRVQTTFPKQLWRGGAYREFDVTVHNPSTVTYRNVHAGLAMTGLIDVPISPDAGSLSVKDIRLEKRSGDGWTRLTVVPGCDPTPSATLGGPVDLPAGSSWTLHLRISLASSPATKPHPALFWLDAQPAGNGDVAGTVSGSFMIEPGKLTPIHRGSPGRPTTTAMPVPTAAPAASPTASGNQPGAPVTAAGAQAGRLPDTGPATWQLAAGSALLLLGGIGAVLVARRLRRPAGD